MTNSCYHETDPSCRYPYKPLWSVGIDAIRKDYTELDIVPCDADVIRVTTQSFANYTKNYTKLNIIGFRLVEETEVIIKKLWDNENDVKFNKYTVDFYVPSGHHVRTYVSDVERKHQHKDFINSLGRVDVKQISLVA